MSSETIEITVPEQVTATFVVASDRADPPLPATGPPEPFAAAAAERLGTPALSVTAHRADASPWDLHRPLHAPDEEDATSARKAAHHIGVTATVPAHDLPFGLQLARAVTGALADAVTGVPIDIDTRQVVPFRDGPEPSRFALADDWLGAWLPPVPADPRCPAADDDHDGCACLEFTTRGLTRLGLPELRMTAVGCRHDLAALNVLRTTAQRLLPLGRSPGRHLLPRELPLTGADFGAYWGADEPMWTGPPLPVQLTRLRPNLLRVGPPADWPGSQNEWLWDELPPALYDLVSYTPDPTAAQPPQQ
ncbi:hypothetical protein [Actinomadura keratinilytica]|jgi:hypothetical protein|uniref:Uncharacterized protein n=1 Tax=Actinomadura keratinilytica TaxID=547461 RepID=A0ABP7Z9V7_9ACTN